jgi:hypothetical protein
MAQRMGFDILVNESAGSIDNIRRLVGDENATLGIMQLDVLGFLNCLTDPQMRRIVSGLRLMFPFYQQEVDLLARTDIRGCEDFGRTLLNCCALAIRRGRRLISTGNRHLETACLLARGESCVSTSASNGV